MTSTDTKLPKITPPRSARVPMRNRTVKVDDETWQDAHAKASADGINLSDVVRHYLREYAQS